MSALIISCFVLLVVGLLASGFETVNGRKWTVRPSRLIIAGSAVCALFAVSLAFSDPNPPASQQVRAAPKAEAPDVGQPARLAKCKEILADADTKLHAWKSWQRDGEYVTVEVRDSYYLADFDAKVALNQMVRCVATDAKMHDDSLTIVSYIDARTHKEVAQWGKYTGFKVRD